MKATKAFDCVAMKRNLQAKLRKKWAGLTTEQIQDAIQKDLATSQTPLARWWRKMAKNGNGKQVH